MIIVDCCVGNDRLWPVLRGQAHRRRVLRGGSFNNNDRNVRCAARDGNNPNNQNRNNGFRVVLSTFFATGLSLPEVPAGYGLAGRGEKWLSLFLAALARTVDPEPLRTGRANTNGPAPWIVRSWCGATRLVLHTMSPARCR